MNKESICHEMPLSQPHEAERLRKLSLGIKLFAYTFPPLPWLVIVTLAILDGEFGLLTLVSIAIAVAIAIPLMGLIVFWPIKYIPWDVSHGQKIVETTQLLKTKKLGFFDTETGASGMIFGSAYYLWIPDERKRSGRRRFRIRMHAYQMIHGWEGHEITIAYLPKSRYVLTIDTPYGHYASYADSSSLAD